MTVTPSESINALDAVTLAEIARVRESGVLGATGRLVELFDFLASRSADNRPPKEAEIALAVFGKADSEALRDDPVARVYIHRLRKRLDDFYLRHGTPAGVRLDIPKGDYRIVSAAPQDVTTETETTEASATVADASPAKPASRKRWGLIAAGFAALLVGGNIAAWALLANKPVEKQIADAGIWTEIANSTRPLLIVVGDYYMFGEYEERVTLKRLVRDFAINSKEDLIHSQRDNPAGFDQYSDVAMQYLPASAAYALTDLAPLLREGRQVQVTLASELTPERLKSDFPRFDFAKYPSLTFEKPDTETFRNLALAFEALNRAGNMPCVLNAANEVAVAEFLKDNVGFLEMSDIVENCLERMDYIKSPRYEDYVNTDKETRIRAYEFLNR